MEEEWRLTIADDRSLSEYYGRGDLAAKILEALRAAGKDPDALTIEDLSPIDQLHARGRGAPLELGRLADITAGMRVLEVGSTARTAPQRALALHEILAGPVSPASTSRCRGREIRASASRAHPRRCTPPSKTQVSKS
jgi:hypothetical protein